MIIVGVWNPKGGNGKTTLAVNVAAAAHHSGLKVMLIDKDRQRSILEAAENGGLPFTVLDEMPATRPDVDLILVDYPAQHFDDLLYGEPIVLTPVLPSRMNFGVWLKNKAYIETAKQVVVVNSVDIRKASHKEVAHQMRKRGAFVVKNRSVYERSFDASITIFDKQCDKIGGVGQARGEMDAILSGILSAANN